MLTRFEAQGFKLLRDVAVDLSPLTVLVGANGSGKTTVLDGIDWVLSEARKATNSGYWPPVAPLAGRDFDALCSRPDASRIGLVLQRDRGTARRIGFEVDRETLARRATDDDSPSKRALEPELDQWPSHVRLNLATQRLAEPSIASTGQLRLMPDGSGLPTVLHDVAGLRDGTIEAIEADLARLVPEFRRIHTHSVELAWTENEWLEVDGRRLPRTIKRTGGGYRLELAFDRIGRIPATQVSEGTLLALGLITALRVDAPELILVDDAERALHPTAQQVLVRLLHDAIDRSQDRLQIVATTHSPYLVDACEPEEVRVFGRRPDGSAAVRALTAHPEAGKWRELLETGEFWSSVGEGWVAEVDAASEAAR